MGSYKISVKLDPGFIFDVLSVLNLKLNKLSGPNKDLSFKNFQDLSSQIKNEIGEGLFITIIGSDEYKSLYEANLVTFNLVDRAQKSDGLAREVADSNTARFHAKNKLQEKFFNCKTTEVKV